jgi:DHA1 family tetracycline resistance protein-like MFS transporter
MATAQAVVLRALVPRLGERRTALTGVAVAVVGYLGFATATQAWMMFAWLGTWLLGALVMPVTNALMSHRVAANAQGELQGAVASLYSLSSIVGPPLLAQLFGYFAGPAAPVSLPGAAFVAAAVLSSACWVIYWAATRERPSVATPQAVAASPLTR